MQGVAGGNREENRLFALVRRRGRFLGWPCLISRERFDQPAEGPIVELMQNSNQLAIRTLARREPWSILDAQRPDVGAAVFSRYPAVLVTVTSIDRVQCSVPLAVLLPLELRKYDFRRLYFFSFAAMLLLLLASIVTCYIDTNREDTYGDLLPTG